MLSTNSIRASRGGSHVPRKSYGRFEFLVCDWSLMKSSPGANIVSQEFVMSDNSTWVLKIFPGGSSGRQAGFVSVHMTMIGLGNNTDSVTATFNISVLGRKEMRQAHNPQLDKTYALKSPSAMDFSLASEAHSSWQVDNFMLANELESKFLDNDAVLFALDIEVLGKPELITTTMPAYMGPLGTLNEDLEALYNTADDASTFSDITLVAGQRKIKCHRSILAARSEVLKKKFLTSTFNTKMMFTGSHYHLDDLAPAVFEEMVRFIYTDSCSHDALALNDRGMLAMAIRFKLPRLIQICEDHIGETLTPDNVIDTLNFAADLKSERLDVCCSEFIAGNQNSVLATRTLCNLRPEALKDLIAKSILPASSLLLAGSVKSDVVPPSEGADASGEAATAAAAACAACGGGVSAANEASEEIKDDEKDKITEKVSSLTEKAGEKLKTSADFIPAAGGIAKSEVVA